MATPAACEHNNSLSKDCPTCLKEQLYERVRENAAALERVQALGRQRKLDVEAQGVARWQIEQLTAENLALKERVVELTAENLNLKAQIEDELTRRARENGL